MKIDQLWKGNSSKQQKLYELFSHITSSDIAIISVDSIVNYMIVKYYINLFCHIWHLSYHEVL